MNLSRNFKNTALSIFAFAAMACFFVSCGSDSGTDATAAARESLTSTTKSITADAGNAAANAVNAANPATATPPVPTGPTTTMTLDETEFDFGTIDEGEKVSHVYKFTNTGEEPLIISNAKGSCGCTVPKWPKDPIAPGEKGEILVEFNSKNKKGKQSKRVTLTANTNPTQSFLTIKGEVTPDPNKPATPAAKPTITPPAAAN